MGALTEDIFGDLSKNLEIRAKLPRMLNSTRLPHDARFLDRIDEIADAYDRAPVFEYRALSAWRELADDSVRRASAIGRWLEVIETDDPEPYPDAPAMCADIATHAR